MSAYSPKPFRPAAASRGAKRLLYPQALPLLDNGASVGYEGSIAKDGSNRDWDWLLYRDERGEYVLFETDGPGCLYNFTQHRRTQPPVYRFYLDGSDTPALELRPEDFGFRDPVSAPLSGRFEKPDAIWVLRGFVPMEFRTHCKVTSDIPLLGIDDGGWGHVTYALYDNADGLETYAGENADELQELCRNLASDPKYSAENVTAADEFTLSAGESRVLYAHEGEGAVSAVRLTLNRFRPEQLGDLRLRITWDGHDTPDVDAPIGTFFGNECGQTADLRTLMLGMQVQPDGASSFYNFFAMPYWKSARIEIRNLGNTTAEGRAAVDFTPASVCRYDPARTGYFVSSVYYEKTDNTAGKNSVIAVLNGSGHMVYGVIGGYDIQAGCEGDVRVFLDGKQSPIVESDGSESWGSWGWGFCVPPQCHPFSCYNGTGNELWSEMRLTLGDSYYFRESLRFELEHGPINDGMGQHSGQIFAYMRPGGRTAQRLAATVDLDDDASRKAAGYVTNGSVFTRKVRSAYENGWDNHVNDFLDTVQTVGGFEQFTVTVGADNRGVLLQRRASQREGKQIARVYVDGAAVTERLWMYADSNPLYEWLDDDFTIPARYTSGKDRITVTVEPVTESFNAAQYRVFALTESE